MTSKERRTQRVKVIQILYSIELTGNEPIDVLNETNVDEETRNLVLSIINALPRIDELIEKCLTNYTLDRLGFVDRAIIRLATYEMLNGLPKNIAINEAIEITKEFTDNGDGKAKSFNNRLLDNISKVIGD